LRFEDIGCSLARVAIGVALLVVASAFVHAWWNALLKRSREPEQAVIGISAFAALTSGVIALALGAPAASSKAFFWVVLSGVLEAAYFVTLAKALSLAPLGPVYTIVRGGALLLVWPVSVLLLGERITAWRAAGTALVALGLVSTGTGERNSGSAVHARGIALAALCACFTGGYHLAYKVSLSSGAAPEIVVSVSLAIAALVNLVQVGAVRRRKIVEAAREQPGHVIGGGVLAAVGFLVFLHAMKKEGAGVVLTLRNTSILFAQLFGFFMGDRPKRLGVIGAILVFAGAVLLAK
jgi:drug/metabolite transporter (DMT)-like permease